MMVKKCYYHLIKNNNITPSLFVFSCWRLCLFCTFINHISFQLSITSWAWILVNYALFSCLFASHLIYNNNETKLYIYLFYYFFMKGVYNYQNTPHKHSWSIVTKQQPLSKDFLKRNKSISLLDSLIRGCIYYSKPSRIFSSQRVPDPTYHHHLICLFFFSFLLSIFAPQRPKNDLRVKTSMIKGR